jgi:sensor histidine kinase
MTPSPTADQPRTHDEHKIDWISLGFSAPWLIFLGYIYDGLLEPNAPVWKHVYVIICLVIFSITDVAAYTVPWVLPVSSYFRRLLLWTALLFVPVCGVMLIAAIPPTDVLIGFTIYFVALWTFSEDIPYSTRIRGAFAIAAVSWIIYMFSDGFPINFAEKSRLTLSLGAPMIGIMAFSYLIQMSKNADKTQAKLDMVSERERIAHDVHDVLGHSLTVITLKADLARKLLHADPDRADAELEAIAQLSRSSLAEVRSTVTRLRIPDFSGEIQASERALQTASVTAKLPDAERALSAVGVNSSLFSWVLREAVTNIVRHSQAGFCEVRVSNTGLEILDNGVGVPAEYAAGSGIKGMKSRVESAGGTLVVEDAPARWLRAHPAASGTADVRGTRLRVSMDGNTAEIEPSGETDD